MHRFFVNPSATRSFLDRMQSTFSKNTLVARRFAPNQQRAILFTRALSVNESDRSPRKESRLAASHRWSLRSIEEYAIENDDRRRSSARRERLAIVGKAPVQLQEESGSVTQSRPR